LGEKVAFKKAVLFRKQMEKEILIKSKALQAMIKAERGQ
jgi:hypothetical protein